MLDLARVPFPDGLIEGNGLPEHIGHCQMYPSRQSID